MDYCLGNGDGMAGVWSAEPDLDVNGDGVLDGIALDFDADNHLDDAIADFDGDGLADHVVFDVGADGEAAFTDDGSGTWAVSVERGGQLRFFGLDGVEATGGPVVDVDGDGALDRLLDGDRDGTADRVLAGERAYVDTDGDGRWDVTLSDTDGDGLAEHAD
ncbi:pullulanase [Mycolicibacterium arenosum]|uniref:Pullulanase n=1 Tax=Mycolicibacterium arenosum TaxID=2952157 RepID=A0ABT1M7S7_9MYCO|nr:pullulanase [Mycolicibacterium sp. CAU 1645]MCP9274925.1 pullulanase [Mycolicibacterium sp. CAU 1645]